MPWKSKSIMESRRAFVRLAQSDDVSMSLRPHTSLRRSDAAVEASIVELRGVHPRWRGREIAR